MPKILIGIPGFDGIVPECQESINGMVFRLGRDSDYDVAIKVITKSEQFRARNKIVNMAIAGQFDYLLMLDDDMFVPHDLPKRLIAHNKDIVGALYYQRGGMFNPVVMTQSAPDAYGETKFSFWPHNDKRLIENPGLYPCDVIGGGCMLFRTHVFEAIPQPYFEWERELGTDIAICTKLRQAGFQPYIDTSVELGHIGNKQIITSRTIPIDRRMQAEAAEELGKDLADYYSMPTDWVVSQMEKATAKNLRRDHWGDRTNEWEDVRSYYQENPDWHIFNIAGFNIYHQDQYRAWMMNEGDRLLNGGNLLDYGPGCGIVTIPLARRNRVHAVEVKDAATLKFLRFRQNKHWGVGQRITIHETETAYPEIPLPDKMDGACCISVLNHLTHPLETVQWIRDQLKPGAFFVCDWMMHSDHHDGHEPQHIDAYDVSMFVPFMHSQGFTTSPEFPWLFFYNP